MQVFKISLLATALISTLMLSAPAQAQSFTPTIQSTDPLGDISDPLPGVPIGNCSAICAYMYGWSKPLEIYVTVYWPNNSRILEGNYADSSRESCLSHVCEVANEISSVVTCPTVWVNGFNVFSPPVTVNCSVD